MTTAAARTEASGMETSDPVSAAPLHVHGPRDWFEMPRVHARTVATQMIDFQAGRDFAAEVLVEEAMRQHSRANAIPTD